MLRTALLGGNTINLDSDYSKYIETVSGPGVIEGFAVEGERVKPGKAWVKVTRSNGESLFVLVQNTQDIPVSLNGDVFIGIEIAQNAIDNGLMNNEDGTGIASIKVGPQKPDQNYLLLAVWQGGRLSDKREFIPKLQSLSQRTSTLEQKMESAENNISVLQDKGTPAYLGKWCVVGESYQDGDVMVEKEGVLIKAYKEINYQTRIPRAFVGKYLVGRFEVPKGEEISIDFKIDLFTSSGSFEKIVVLSNKEYSSLQDYKDNPGTVYASTGNGGGKIYFVKNDNSPVYITLFCSSSYETYPTEGERSIKFEISNGKELPKFYPREVKGVGERVECTIMGLHSNGGIIQPKPVEIVLGKEMSGTFTATREAPNSGYLELTYKTGSSNSQYGWINIGEVGLNTSEYNRTERIFVQKGPIVFKGGGREGYAINTYLKLEKFTSVM